MSPPSAAPIKSRGGVRLREFTSRSRRGARAPLSFHMSTARLGFIVMLVLCGCNRAQVLRLEARLLELEERARKIELREESYRRAAAQQDSALRESARQLESARALRDAAKVAHQRSLREAEEQRKGKDARHEQIIEQMQKTIAQQDKHVQASLLLKDENFKLKERLRELEAQLEAAGASRGE